MKPDRIFLSENIEISRILTGLWQVADQEKGGSQVDVSQAAGALVDYADAGFDTFDMADHYGSAEIITGHALKTASHAKAFTKWCPKPGPMTAGIVRAGVEERLRRLDVDQIDLLQLHWWNFEHPAWLDALGELKLLQQEGLIYALAVTNFDAAHLEIALEEGIPLVSNQVSFSLLDRRPTGRMSEICAAWGVKLLTYGTLCGGFIADRWLGMQEPKETSDLAGMKYRRFIDAAGGWDAFQNVLQAAHNVAEKHGVSASNVATRWVLDQPHVAGVIVGARLGENVHQSDNAKVFSFEMDDEDRATIDRSLQTTTDLPGDCGDEYRRPPFLTPSGDLSQILAETPSVLTVKTDERGRRRAFSGSKWEPVAGFCRGVRENGRILIAGSTATHGFDHNVASNNARAQATYILDKIAATMTALGGSMSDIVRNRTYVTSKKDVEGACQAPGKVFSEFPPVNTTFMVDSLVGDFCVEIEAEAIVRTTDQ